MNIKKQQIWKSIYLLVFAFTTSLFLFTGCASDDDVYVEPQVVITENGVLPDRNEVSFSQESSTKTIEVTSNREWKIIKSNDTDWIDIDVISGEQGTTPVAITVKSNQGNPRKAFFTIEASTVKIAVRVNQASVDGVEFEYFAIQQVRDMYSESGQETFVINKPLLLEAVVISDRDGGNSTSLKNGFLQDKAGTGITFRVTESIHEFDMGDELNLDLEGAVLSQYAGAIQLGFSTSKAVVQATDIAVAPKEVTIEDIKSNYLDGTLVKIKDVQFQEYIGLTYYEGTGSAQNRTLENEDGDKIVARTARYADFKDEPLPKGSGNIVGILSVFNNNWQLNIRNLNDVKEMSDDVSTRYVQEASGDDILSEPFASKIGSFTEHKVVGEADWFGHTYDGEEYVRITGYQKGANENWLISPAMDLSDVTEARLTFRHAVAHWVGDEDKTLTVWVSSVYENGNPTEVEWEQVKINLPPAGSYYEWADVSTVIPKSMIGKEKVHLAFRYTNEDGKACTWQVQKVIVN